MVNYLIDANLPYYFSMWNTDQFIHQLDRNDEEKDHQIWEFAKKNDLTIVTKDSDFADRILLRNPPPRVIQIKFGNMRMNDFYNLMRNIWTDIAEASRDHKLVLVFKDRIECIN